MIDQRSRPQELSPTDADYCPHGAPVEPDPSSIAQTDQLATGYTSLSLDSQCERNAPPLPCLEDKNTVGPRPNYPAIATMGSQTSGGESPVPTTEEVLESQPSAHGHRTPILNVRTGWDNHHANAPGSQHTHPAPLRQSASSTSLPRRTHSTRTNLAAAQSSAGSLSPGSVFSSPQLAGLTDITPLPSPIQLSGSPWRSGSTHSLPRTPSTSSQKGFTFGLRSADTEKPPRSASIKRRAYPDSTLNVVPAAPEPKETETHITVPKRHHNRNRSLSEYVPPALIGPGPRGTPCALPGKRPPPPKGNKIQREEYLAVQRGIALPAARPPSPPSTRHGDTANKDNIPVLLGPNSISTLVYDVKSIRTSQPRRYRMIRQLGHGTFSQVVLAVREETITPEVGDMGSQKPMPPRLVAVKVVEYGPAGGANEERVEVSLKREVDILRTVNHPSVVQLKAFGSDERRALLVLDYCPGGDLFEFASHGPNYIRPQTVRRIFAELVRATRYLHQHQIVHRDIKLENVLVNIPATMMQDTIDWRKYPKALITLSDLGLSRRIPQPPESPLLHTRCGSEDYAAPEILMGQPYDGRATDAWALGVLLYAIVENRLPFDPLPGTRGDPAKLRARTPHRIARCEWSWYRFGDEDGEWDAGKGRELDGAQLCVQSLLRRSSRRATLDEIAEMDWVRDAIELPEGGLKRGDIEVP